MTLAQAPDTLQPAELSPDSGGLRVSLNTAFESGIPPARERLSHSGETDEALEQLDMVLVESTRAEANLGLLLRGLKHLASGASAAQEANAQLMLELDTLRTRIARVYQSESVLQKRVSMLENALDAAARERDSWLLQEDAFLAELLDDHERSLLEQERKHDRRLAELDQVLEQLRLQRDGSRTEVTRLTYERDAAVALLNEPVTLAQPALTPTPTSGVQKAVVGSLKLPAPSLRPKPELNSRPLVGYSVAPGQGSEERLDVPKSSSRPPRG